MSEGYFQDKILEHTPESLSTSEVSSHNVKDVRKSSCEGSVPHNDLSISDKSVAPSTEIPQRPYITGRNPIPRDSVQPRGGSSFTRIPPRYTRGRQRSAFGSGLGMDEELGIQSTQEHATRSGIDENHYRENGNITHENCEHDQVESNSLRGCEEGGEDSLNNNCGDSFPRENASYKRNVSDSLSDMPESEERSCGNRFEQRHSGRLAENREERSNFHRVARGNYRGNYRNYSRGDRGDYHGDYRGDLRNEERFEGRGGYAPRRPYGANYPNNGGGNNYGTGRAYGYRRGSNVQDNWQGNDWRNSNNSGNSDYNSNFGYGSGRTQGYGGRSRRRNFEGYSTYNPAFPELQGSRSNKEPLSLAEELAEEMNRGHRNDATGKNEKANNEILLRDESVGRLQQLSMAELIEEARRFEIGIPDEENARKHDIIFRIIQEKIKLNGLLYGEGTLEILPDGFGFLRSTEYHYLSCPDDIYVSPSQIRRFGLKNGTIVSGQIRPPKENERYFALLRVEAINFQDPNEFSRKKHFDELIPTHPTERIRLEVDEGEVETRVLDMMVPIGFGQRGLMISPPKAGKTTLLQKIAKAALKNYPDLYVFILLIDERPEEVTEMRRQVSGLNCEVVCSTFDEPTMRHIQVADIVLEKAKRMVEFGQNVVILLDSITRLTRAWGLETQPGMSPRIPPMVGFDIDMLQIPKRFFCSARCVEEGGSLTILATALTETNSPIDDAILEEFKGNGNLEIVLDSRLVEQHVWPAIDLNRSGTRREERLLTNEEFQSISKLRHVLFELNPVDAMEMLTNRLRKTKTNAEFLTELLGAEAEECAENKLDNEKDTNNTKEKGE